MQPDPTTQDQEALQTTVCISAVGDGTYTVYMQGDQDDSQNATMGGTDDSEDQPQTAQDIDSALQIAKQMLTGEAQEDDSQAPPVDGNAPLSPEDAQTAWKQMAAKKKPMGM